MHFGRVNSVTNQNISLPPDALRTTKFLNLPHDFSTDIYFGCPVWAERGWVDSLYPKGTKSTDYLKHYAQHFNTVEINSTFYQLLDAERMRKWREKVPPHFRFCPKVYRVITEELGSNGLPQLIEIFCSSIRALKPNLGLVFAQLPESIGPRQGRLLNRFLTLWPSDLPLAVEFRHPGWFQNHTLPDELVNFLYKQKIATVITDTLGRRDALHLSLTQPKVMIRFQGNELNPSDHIRLKAWAARIHEWRSHNLDEIYFFAHQPSEKNIPQTAHLMMKEFQNLCI